MGGDGGKGEAKGDCLISGRMFWCTGKLVLGLDGPGWGGAARRRGVFHVECPDTSYVSSTRLCDYIHVVDTTHNRQASHHAFFCVKCVLFPSSSLFLVFVAWAVAMRWGNKGSMRVYENK